MGEEDSARFLDYFAIFLARISRIFVNNPPPKPLRSSLFGIDPPRQHHLRRGGRKTRLLKAQQKSLLEEDFGAVGRQLLPCSDSDHDILARRSNKQRSRPFAWRKGSNVVGGTARTLWGGLKKAFFNSPRKVALWGVASFQKTFDLCLMFLFFFKKRHSWLMAPLATSDQPWPCWPLICYATDGGNRLPPFLSPPGPARPFILFQRRSRPLRS